MTDIDRRSAVRLMCAGALGLGASRLMATGEPVLERPIPSSGEKLPVIGLGTWQVFDVGRDASARAPLHDVLRAFVDLGGKLVDSSPMYGSAEEVVGDI